MMQAWADIVAADGVNRKGFASVSGLVGKDFDAGWSKRRFVIVEMTMYLSMCGKLWIDLTWAKKVEG